MFSCVFLNILPFMNFYEVFSEAIPYLTPLLINSRLRLHLRKSIFTEVDPVQIISVDLPSLPRRSSPSLADCVNLRSLILHDMEEPLILVEQPLSSSLEILNLNISLRNKPAAIPRLMQLLVRLPKLKLFTLIYPSSYFVLREDMVILPKVSNTVRNVKLDVRCSIACLEKLSRQLLSLRRLQAQVASNLETSTTSPPNALFPTIENLSLAYEYIPFQHLITFCRKMPNLRECNLISSDYRYDQDVLSPTVWHQFIEVDHVVLQKLVIDIRPQPGLGQGRFPPAILNDPYFRSINFKFNSNCWGNRGLEGCYVRPV